jgi:hypothetical protein
VKVAALLLAFGVIASAGTPKLIFTKSFPGSTPPYVYLSVDRNGALEYREAQDDAQPVRAQLPDADVAALFASAEKLDYFKKPLESGLKVANTGKKTFRYEDENTAGSEATFNYSQNEMAQQLLDRFEQIAESERAYAELDRTVHFDKLGVNDALAAIESLWLRKQLAAPQQFIPLLTRIANHETFMHLVRERAARLKDAFAGTTASASAVPNANK